MGVPKTGTETASSAATNERPTVVIADRPSGLMGLDLKAALTDLNSPLRLTWFLGACILGTAVVVLGLVFFVVGHHIRWWETVLIMTATSALVALSSFFAWQRARTVSERLRRSAEQLADIERKLLDASAEVESLSGLLVDAVESVDEGFVLFDAENTLVVCNDRYRAAYPMIADLLQPGASFSDILRVAAARSGAVNAPEEEDLSQWVDDRLYRHLRSSEPLECRLADGRWYRISERPTRARGIVKVLSDITTAKAHQQELATKTDVLESTFDAMAQGVAVFDDQNCLVTWNDHLAAVMDYPHELLVAGTPCEAFTDFDKARGVPPVQICVSSAPADDDVDTSLLAPKDLMLADGSEWILPNGRHVEVNLNTMPRGGKVVTFSDITARKQAESALQHAQKMDAIGQLAGGIAHEFNNILTSIGGFARMALRSPDDHERVVMCLGEVTKTADRAASLTSQLLNFSRRSVTEELRPVLLKDMIKDLTSFLRPILGEQVDVYVTINDPDIMVAADPARLHQAIVNLCINARDAMPEGGNISLTLDRKELTEVAERHPQLSAPQYACLSVTDSGSGIDPTYLDRIFEPFFTTKEQGKGTGLGLPMVYSTAEHANGTVEVESTVGEGSTFRLLLPILNQKRNTDGQSADSPAFDGYGLTILLAEDEDSVRRFITLTLEESDCTVLTATNGEEAIAIFQEAADLIDVLISDVVMPTMDGPTLARTLLKQNPDLSVILMSGYSPTNDWKPLTEGKGRIFLPKPIDPMTLIAAVQAVRPDGQEACS